MSQGEFKNRAVLPFFPIRVFFRIDCLENRCNFHVPRAHGSLIYPNFVFIISFFQWWREGDEGKTAGHERTRNYRSCLELGICVVE